MDQEVNISKTKSLELLVADFTRDMISRLIGPETEKYLGVSENFRNELNAYREKLTEANKESSISLFLFESLNTTANLQNVMKEAIGENPSDNYQEILGNLKSEVPALFGIQPGPEKSEVVDIISSLFQKKSSIDLSPYFMLSELVIKTMDENKAQLNQYFESISKLLLNLWETSKLIASTVSKIADNEASQINTAPIFDSQTVNEQVIRLEEEFRQSEKGLLDSVHETILLQHRKIEDKSLPLPEPVYKNRQIYSLRNSLRSLEKTTNHYKKLIENWHNTFIVLADDWMLELEISHLKYFILKQHFDFKGLVSNRFIEPMAEHTKNMEEIVNELSDLFEEKAGNEAGKLTDGMEQKRTEIKRKLVLRMMPEIKKITLESDIPAKIDEFENNTANQFKQLSEVRIIKENTKYDEPTEKNDLDKISPRTLVSFQMMPRFMERFPLLKQSFIRHLQLVQNKVEEIPEIIDYTLASSKSFYEEKKDKKEAEKIGMEGIKRTSNKINDLNNLVESFYEEEFKSLKSDIEKLTRELTEITNNESALQIKMRITKARAVEKSRQLRIKIFTQIKDLLPRIGRVFQGAFRFLRESSIRISKQFILEDKKHFIATDVSDYLTETEQAINRLPFIYQRLFKTEPLTSFELYTDRTDEIEKLKKAYSKWKEGKFAPTAIIAEKGWGKTTLVNRFLKLNLTHEEIINITPEPETGMDEFFETLMHKVPPEKPAAKHQDSPIKKRIVVLDGLEKLFEVRINGLDHLSKLLQYISDTNHYVFWITTCHQYAWEFLEKTLEVSDFFGYHIKLSDLTDEELMKTILRRHNISGYRLMFLPEAQKKSLISFKKQADFGDQDELKKQYFTRMHRIVKGNLSQAFLFWMRSTSEVTEDAVYIEYIGGEYFNFLGSMSDPKLMILKNIVVHNGIKAQQHAQLFRIEHDKSKLLLQQLHDDGIIIKNGEVYNINPIIYRQVIDHLYLLNILH